MDSLTADLLVYNPRLLSSWAQSFPFLFQVLFHVFRHTLLHTAEFADAHPLLRLPATHIAPDRLGKPYQGLKGKISRAIHTPGSRIGIYSLLYIVHLSLPQLNSFTTFTGLGIALRALFAGTLATV